MIIFLTNAPFTFHRTFNKDSLVYHLFWHSVKNSVKYKSGFNSNSELKAQKCSKQCIETLMWYSMKYKVMMHGMRKKPHVACEEWYSLYIDTSPISELVTLLKLEWLDLNYVFITSQIYIKHSIFSNKVTTNCIKMGRE